jgi:hypothetical protein
MRDTIEQYIRRCDPCQRRKENREMIAPLGNVEEPIIPFEVTSMDITGPYPTTSRRNKYLLTFIDHMTKYVEAFPIPDHTAETCTRVYASQIVTRHGSGSTLITVQAEVVILLPKKRAKYKENAGCVLPAITRFLMVWWKGSTAPSIQASRIT